MELYGYLFVYFLSLIFIFQPNILKDKSFFIFWFIVMITLSIIIRSSIGEVLSYDIDGYVSVMKEI